VQIPAAVGGFLRERGHWEQAAALHQTALLAARHAGDSADQAGTLHELSLKATITGDFRAAADSLAQAVALHADIGDRAGQAYATCQQANAQFGTGHYHAAIASHEQALSLARGSGDQRAEACALRVSGLHAAGDRRLQRLRGESGRCAGPTYRTPLCLKVKERALM
jgi:tetratricopeptide (TPR) repeat protein